MIPDTFYHIYNRACGFDKIFVEERNYHFFMDLFQKRLLEYVDLYSYCLIPNYYYNRKGSLFSQNFRRKLITDDDYLKTVVIYIHRNPIKHGLVNALTEWKHSSYMEFLNGCPRYCKKNDVLDWFSTKEIYKFCHTLDSDSDIE